MNQKIFLVAVLVAFGTITTLACAKDQERAAGKTTMNHQQNNQIKGETIIVRVVSTADCANTPPTIQLIKDTAREMGLQIDISRQIVSTQNEANQYRFIGSPTVQIDGLDLQKDMRDNTRYGFT